jgi:hypothetical protein
MSLDAETLSHPDHTQGRSALSRSGRVFHAAPVDTQPLDNDRLWWRARGRSLPEVELNNPVDEVVDKGIRGWRSFVRDPDENVSGQHGARTVHRRQARGVWLRTFDHAGEQPTETAVGEVGREIAELVDAALPIRDKARRPPQHPIERGDGPAEG